MQIKSILVLTTAVLVLLFPFSLLSQNHLDVEGDVWVKERLEINTSAPNAGEYIWNPTGVDLRFFTGFTERLRINGSTAGGDIMIFQMDTITSAKDTTAGNVVRLLDGTLAIRQYKVGDMAQGGMVFWVDETGEHGLVSSLTDIESTTGDFTHQWSTVNEFTGSTGDGIGAGAMNTILIISAQRGDTDSAARLCADLLEGGYADWYLPSLLELNEMFTKIGQGATAPNTNIGNFADSFYWSSSEFIDSFARAQDFSDGDQGGQGLGGKSGINRVRAIRAF